MNCTHESALRLIPATNSPREVPEEGLGILEGVLGEQD